MCQESYIQFCQSSNPFVATQHLAHFRHGGINEQRPCLMRQVHKTACHRSNEHSAEGRTINPFTYVRGYTAHFVLAGRVFPHLHLHRSRLSSASKRRGAYSTLDRLAPIGEVKPRGPCDRGSVDSREPAPHISRTSKVGRWLSR